MRYDIVIIGAGIAALHAALRLPKDKKVLIVCKSNSWDCNTFYAQGGVAVPADEDDIKTHIEDTLRAGAGLCDRKAVEVMCKDGYRVVREFIEMGFEFDKDENGNLLYTKEAAHSRNRILHAGGDATGRLIHLFLMKNNPFPLLYKSTVVDLLVEGDTCYGVTVFYDGEFRNIYAKNVIIASGGIGSLYEYHTNAKSISSDIQGICLEKGCELRDMEMLQFHPTVFIHNKGARKQLLTEALRGEGAYIVDETGERFLFRYDERGELSPRDIVSRAMFDWKMKTGREIYLSFDNFSEEFFRKRFPTIYYHLKDLGFNLPKDRVPISPAFHYAMGGIKTDLNGKVPGMRNLYAVGEAANTRVHGANRLASNSLLEGFVFSVRAVNDILNKDEDIKIKEFPVNREVLVKEGDKELKNRLRRLMWEHAGIIRKESGLKKALKELDEMFDKDIGKLLRLRLLTSKKIVQSAIDRKESLGAHYIVKE
ncbi:MAG: L-aspartate oxidase [Epsilonproteobacteria bacterium]|nr:L-aspartate oxidase [Campylobacterota bacterium]